MPKSRKYNKTPTPEVAVKEEPMDLAQDSVVQKEPVAPAPSAQPEKRKRVRSAWLNFYSHYYAHNKPKQGTIKVTEICREAAGKWGGLTDEQKSKWKNPPANLG